MKFICCLVCKLRIQDQNNALRDHLLNRLMYINVIILVSTLQPFVEKKGQRLFIQVGTMSQKGYPILKWASKTINYI